MRIALTFPGCHRRGGVERVVLECANFLASRGHEVHLLASQADHDALSASVVHHPIHSMQRSCLSVIDFAVRSRLALNSLQGIGVHAGFGIHSPAGAVLWVQSVHRAWLEISQRQRDFMGRMRQRINPFHPLILALERFYFAGRRYKKLIALTPQVKADLIRLYDVPGEDVELLPNGFSANEFNVARVTRERAAIRAELKYRDEDRVVVFAANELERKGFGPLLRAAAHANERMVKLLVVGRVTPTRYQAEIERLHMADRVRFVGSTSDVARYYAAADVFALPTQYEAWGLVIVEALACGLPVVTSRLAGAATAVREGVTGELLDDPRDHLEIAAKLGAVLQRPLPDRHNVSASVSHLSWDQILPRYEQILITCARNVSQSALVGVN